MRLPHGSPRYYTSVGFLVWLFLKDNRSIGSPACSYGSIDVKATRISPCTDITEPSSCGSVNDGVGGGVAEANAILGKSPQTKTIVAESRAITHGDSQSALSTRETSLHTGENESGPSSKTKDAQSVEGHQTSAGDLAAGRFKAEANADTNCSTTSDTDCASRGELVFGSRPNGDAFSGDGRNDIPESNIVDFFVSLSRNSSVGSSLSHTESDETDSSPGVADCDNGEERIEETNENSPGIMQVSTTEGTRGQLTLQANPKVDTEGAEPLSRSPHACITVVPKPARKTSRLRGKLEKHDSFASAPAVLMRKVKDLVARGPSLKKLEEYTENLERLKEVLLQRRSTWAETFSPANYAKLLEQPTDSSIEYTLQLSKHISDTKAEIAIVYGKAKACLLACRSVRESSGKRDHTAEEDLLERASSILSTIQRMIPQVDLAAQQDFSAQVFAQPALTASVPQGSGGATERAKQPTTAPNVKN